MLPGLSLAETTTWTYLWRSDADLLFTCSRGWKSCIHPHLRKSYLAQVFTKSVKRKKMYLPLDLQLQLLHHSFFLFFYSSLSLCFVFSLPSSEAMIHGIFLFTHLSRMFGLTPIVMDAVFCTNTGAFCYLHRIPGFTQVQVSIYLFMHRRIICTGDQLPLQVVTHRTSSRGNYDRQRTNPAKDNKHI